MSAEPYPRAGTAWYALFVLTVCYTFSYVDRQIIAFLIDPLKQELSISDTQIGLLQGIAFALFYTFFGLPMGWLADRYSRRNIVAAGVFFWSLMTALSSTARSYLLALARMGVGLGEATMNPCAFSMISDYFPRERLSTALSTYMMGIQLGAGLALIVGGVVVHAITQMPPVEISGFGTVAPWRLTFLAVGLPGRPVDRTHGRDRREHRHRHRPADDETLPTPLRRDAGGHVSAARRARPRPRRTGTRKGSIARRMPIALSKAARLRTSGLPCADNAR